MGPVSISEKHDRDRRGRAVGILVCDDPCPDANRHRQSSHCVGLGRALGLMVHRMVLAEQEHRVGSAVAIGEDRWR